MLSTPIGKGYIILINDKSLWGKYVLRNADFRFSAQIRSHFLLHQEANHHRYFEGYPYFLPALHWHTNGDISWDIPSFLLSLIYQQLGTLLGTSLLFCCCSIGTQIVTLLGISQHFRPQPKGTFFITSYHFAKRTIGTLFITRLLYPSILVNHDISPRIIGRRVNNTR